MAADGFHQRSGGVFTHDIYGGQDDDLATGNGGGDYMYGGGGNDTLREQVVAVGMLAGYGGDGNDLVDDAASILK